MGFRQNLRVTPLAWVALLIGIAIHLTGFVALSIQTGSDARMRIRSAFVQYPDPGEGEHSTVFKEQAELFDTAPLFLPTSRNHSSSIRKIRLQEEQSALFDSFPAQITLDRSEWDGVSWFDDPKVSDHRGTMGSEFWNVFHRFGSSHRIEKGEDEGGSRMEVVSFGSGATLRNELLPKAIEEAGEGALWNPVTLRILIDRVGAIGEPLMVTSSGLDRVDEAVRVFLKHSATIRGLRPGYYEIRVGP